MTLKILENHLRKKHALPDDFHFYGWEWLANGKERFSILKLDGGICQPLRSGKRKGKPNYKTMTGQLTFFSTIREMEDLDIAYEIETGNCSVCMGDGKVIAGVSVADGTEYRQCSRCSGTGKNGRPTNKGE